MKGTVTRLPKFVRLVPSATLATPSAIVVVAVIGSRSAARADAGDGAFVRAGVIEPDRHVDERGAAVR